MRRRALMLPALWLALVLSGCAGGAHVEPGRWLEVEGAATAAGPEDYDAARRRAVADALLAAALAGGAEVTGHSALDHSRLTSDLLIVRPVGRVLEHRVISREFDGRTWRVRLKARVGPEEAGGCGSGRRILATAYPPVIRVSLTAPAWTQQTAARLAEALLRRLAAHPGVKLERWADRAPSSRAPGREAFDYAALTRGPARPGPGGHGFVPEIEVASDGEVLRLTLRLLLFSEDGERLERVHVSEVQLRDYSLLGNAAPLVAPSRDALARALRKGAEPALDALLDDAVCRPVSARLRFDGGRVTAPVGRDHGLGRGSLAFTSDRDGSTALLEVATLDARQVVLRPLDPGLAAAQFAGRMVSFVETGP